MYHSSSHEPSTSTSTSKTRSFQSCELYRQSTRHTLPKTELVTGPWKHIGQLVIEKSLWPVWRVDRVTSWLASILVVSCYTCLVAFWQLFNKRIWWWWWWSRKTGDPMMSDTVSKFRYKCGLLHVGNAATLKARSLTVDRHTSFYNTH